MGTIDKLIERFKQRPTDFTYDELRRMLRKFSYEESAIGKTSGSRVAFVRPSDKAIIKLHKPHPCNILKDYQMKQIYDLLKERGDIDE